MLVPEASAMRPASILVTMPPRDSSVPALPAMASISGVIWRTSSRRVRVGAAAGRRGVEAVDVGQQHQAVGAHHAGDARGQAVVVAVADFGGRHGVVLVDDRHGALGEQRGDGLAGVEVAAALLGVAERQQDLRGGEPVRLEHRLIGAGERDLADGRGGLRLLERQLAPGQTPARGGRARWRRRRRGSTSLPALTSAATSSASDSSQAALSSPLRVIDQQAGADLDHDAARLGPLRAGRHRSMFRRQTYRRAACECVAASI